MNTDIIDNDTKSNERLFVVTDTNVSEPSPEFLEKNDEPKTKAGFEPIKPEWLSRDEVLELMNLNGLSVLQQSGYFKVEPVKGSRLYFPVTKTVRKFFISGFEVSWDIAKLPDNGIFGQVKQQLIMTGSKNDQLERIQKAIDTLKIQEPKTVKAVRKNKKSDKTDDAIETKSDDTADEHADKAASRAARLELIKKVAAEKGCQVSQKTVDELNVAEQIS
jgi:hypothetical protein